MSEVKRSVCLSTTNCKVLFGHFSRETLSILKVNCNNLIRKLCACVCFSTYLLFSVLTLAFEGKLSNNSSLIVRCWWARRPYRVPRWQLCCPSFSWSTTWRPVRRRDWTGTPTTPERIRIHSWKREEWDKLMWWKMEDVKSSYLDLAPFGKV